MGELLKLQKLSHELLNTRVEYSDLDHIKELFRAKRELGYNGYLEGDKLRLWKASGYSTIFTLELEGDERVYSSRMRPVFRFVFLLLWLTAATLATINYKFLLESRPAAIGYLVLFSVFHLLVSLIYKSARSLEFDALKIYVYQTMENMKATENREPAPYEPTDFKSLGETEHRINSQIDLVVSIIFIAIMVLSKIL